MKNFTRSLTALSLIIGMAATAYAGNLTAYRGQSIDLGTINGVAYYTMEKAGYRVVATLAGANSKAVRFEAVLTPGQTVVLSSPAVEGKTPARIEISRHRDQVHVQTVPVTN